MAFESLIAQNQVKNLLTGIHQTGNVANGYLFVGPEQCGKTTAATEFVKLINCTGETAPCNICPSCTKINHNNSVDLYQLPFENSIKIEQIRELKKYVQYGAYESKYLAVIIPHVEKMTTAAANSFLKLLEEPPENVFFILETAYPNQIIKTIISRCQTINFNQLTDQAISKILKQEHDLTDNEIDKITKISGGILPLAQIYLKDREQMTKIIDLFINIQEKSFNEITSFVDFITSKKSSFQGKTDIIKCLNLIGQLFRNGLQLTKAKIVLKFAKIFQNNINIKLTLTTLLLKLKEVPLS